MQILFQLYEALNIWFFMVHTYLFSQACIFSLIASLCGDPNCYIWDLAESNRQNCHIMFFVYLKLFTVVISRSWKGFTLFLVFLDFLSLWMDVLLSRYIINEWEWKYLLRTWIQIQFYHLTLFLPDLVTWRSCKGWFHPWRVGIGLMY